MKDDGMYGYIDKAPKQLNISAAQTVENEAALLYDRAFDSDYTGYDGVELCSRLHTQPGGGTFANEPETPADLSMTSYKQATIDIAAITNPRGEMMKVTERRLITAKNFEAKAKIILNSPDHPETANRSINPYKNNVDYMLSHYVTDPKAWFIRTNIEGLICQKRKWPVELSSDNIFGNDVAAIKAYFRLAFGWWNARSIYGNPGQ